MGINDAARSPRKIRNTARQQAGWALSGRRSLSGGLARLAGAVHRAAHDRKVQRLFNVSQPALDLFGGVALHALRVLLLEEAERLLDGVQPLNLLWPPSHGHDPTVGRSALDPGEHEQILRKELGKVSKKGIPLNQEFVKRREHRRPSHAQEHV